MTKKDTVCEETLQMKNETKETWVKNHIY